MGRQLPKIPSPLKKSLKDYPIFYQKVWRVCAAIPRGETRSYGQIAQAIGHPRAARAVGQALAKNPFAPRIPCHRVIRKSGGLGGYSAKGGLAKKARLLCLEKTQKA